MSKDTNNIGKTVNLSGMFCGFESRLFAQICLGLGLGRGLLASSFRTRQTKRDKNFAEKFDYENFGFPRRKLTQNFFQP